jgi:AcrR family transcriptional regulator
MSSAVTGTKGVPRAERTSQIVQVAVEEFASRGYSGASVAHIAGRAGISKPLVYQYFGSKDGLFLACLHSVAGPLLERLELAWSQEDDTVLSRVATLGAIFESLEPQRIAWNLLFDDNMPTSGPIAEAAWAYRGRTLQVTASGSERFLRARGIDDALDTSALGAVWMGLVDALVQWWLAQPEVTAAEMTERCRRLISAVLELDELPDDPQPG